MNQYETVFILNPVLSETQIEEAVQKFVEFIKTNQGSMTSQENWGLKKLAYP
ncbi:MAG: 30S ribosomal protein S6, partial [Flavobacteriaceae bacterium]|nr:30S ribosomal protein S6 [Flavobacteriaceae bacterium]